jgi:hypothetical protein
LANLSFFTLVAWMDTSTTSNNASINTCYFYHRRVHPGLDPRIDQKVPRPKASGHRFH